MSDRVDVISQVRYQLSRLAAKNAHHEFEHLCRHLTRLRICSNILPATGPVSSGGDQGRDYETFVTHLRTSGVKSAFAGLASDGPVAFACTLQKKKLPAKIATDLAAICAASVKPFVVHYFCEADLPVSKRHATQAAVRKEHGVHLEIYDGEGISELLSNADTFWIAMRYLDVPADIFPKPSNLPEWYSTYRQCLSRDDKPETKSWGAFFDLKRALRYATFNEQAKLDLPQWIDMMRAFSECETTAIGRKAVYEIAVAKLRGQGSMEGEEEAIRGYLARLDELNDDVDLRDAACLVNYCLGAAFQGASDITLDEVDHWRAKLKTRVAKLLHDEKSPNRRCVLLELSGYVALSGGPGAENANITEALKNWKKLIRLVGDAPLFPLEPFADTLTTFTPVLVDLDDFHKLTAQVDEALANRTGQFLAAEKCRDRAFVLYERDRLLAAINELHRAKISWFADETIEACLLALIFIGRLYFKLGLAHAAKQYALAAASLGMTSTKDGVKELVPTAIALAGRADYYQGAWFNFLLAMETHLLAHNAFSRQLTELSDHEEDLQAAIAHLVAVLALAERTSSDIYNRVADHTSDWALDVYIEGILPGLRERIAGLSEHDLHVEMQQQLGGWPFADVGPSRRTSWCQLGIVWMVEWRNDYQTTLAAEGFLAAFQVLLADLADTDLCVLKTTVEMHLELGEEDEPNAHAVPSNDRRRWCIEVPSLSDRSQEELIDLERWIPGLIWEILLETSLLPEDQFDVVMKQKLHEGMTQKLVVGRPYAALYSDWIEEERFNSLARDLSEAFTSEEWQPREHPELAWRGGPGPGRGAEATQGTLRSRYENTTRALRFTLPRLLKEESFRDLIGKLRSEGWRDWHILGAIASAAITFRVFQDPRAQKDPGYAKSLMQQFSGDENEHDPVVPMSEFSEDNIRRMRKSNMLATLKGLGLQLRQPTPDLVAIEHFLSQRYGYWTDDIDHADPFACDQH